MSAPGVDTQGGSSLPGPIAAEYVAFAGSTFGVIGSAIRGPAFVPIPLQATNGFELMFGSGSADEFGPMAAKAWLDSKAGCTYVRLLGVGDGKKRVSSEGLNSDGENLPAGSVMNSGYVVGSRLTGSTGTLASNPFATDGGLPGRTYFLGAFMSESAGSRYFSDAGIQKVGTNKSATILRGVLFAASGVLPSLSGCYSENASTASLGPTVGSFADKQDGGAAIGAINTFAAAEEFVMLLNGHVPTDDFPNTITASLNPAMNNYFVDVFNTDPTKIQQAGHYLYSYYDIFDAQAKVTGSGVVTAHTPKLPDANSFLEDSVFLLSSSIERNASDAAGDLVVPNFENWNDRFTTAKSPMVISQRIDRKNFDLFRFHALSDGESGNDRIKITISDIRPGATIDDYGQFKVTIREFANTDTSFAAISSEEWANCNLDPSSENYIARLIGDRHRYFDFEKPVERQRLVNDGNHPNGSSYVRVEVSPEIENETLPKHVLPIGYRGPSHLVTSGSGIMSNPDHPLSTGAVVASSTEWAHRLVEPPIPYRLQLSDKPAVGAPPTGTREIFGQYCWGIQSTRQTSVTSPNINTQHNSSLASYTKYYPSHTTQRQKAFVGDNTGVPDNAGTVYDSDRFNNNLFSLENILIHTRSDANLVDNEQWEYAQYRRDRKKIPLRHGSDLTFRTGVRFLDYSIDFSDDVSGNTSEWLSFTLTLQGGFDGANILSDQKKKMKNLAARYEATYANQGLNAGPTISSHLAALRIMEMKSEVDVKILALPGIRVPMLTNAAIETCEQRFDAFCLVDVEEVASGSGLLVSSSEDISSNLTAERFKSRALDSSFAAAYFPDVSMMYTQQTPAGTTEIEVFVPPSVHVAKAIAEIDSSGTVFGPSGVDRGLLSEAVQAKVKFESTQRSTLKKLYDASINPIVESTEGPYIYAQRTLENRDSLFQSIAIRRMVIEIRRTVKELAQRMLFEQGDDQVLKKFETLVKPVLAKMLTAGGITRYKVKIDATTTTKDDMERNLVKGQIFIQPSRSDEIIQVDF